LKPSASEDHNRLRLPQNLLHRFPLCEFIDEFVQVTDFAHGWFGDFLDADAADGACDQGS
jgi:hypothetical protein